VGHSMGTDPGEKWRYSDFFLFNTTGKSRLYI